MFRQRVAPAVHFHKVQGSDKKPRWELRLSLSMVVAVSSAVLLAFAVTIIYSQGVQQICSTVANTPINQAKSSTYINELEPPYRYRTEFSISCNSTEGTSMVATCPANYYPPQPSRGANSEQCPEYFRWIHEDLKPWKKNGITRDMIDDLGRNKKFWRFRLVIVNGTAYVRTYGMSFKNRDIFTLWGILQLLRRYPGQIPDLDLVFNCADKTEIREIDYPEGRAPPLFHYCGSNDTVDIVFPDWSFWGWPEINIKPWAYFKKDLDEGNKLIKWVDREPYAYWRGKLQMGDRKKLIKCNSTKEWNTLIHQQDWKREAEAGFQNSDLSKQCSHRYKIYVDGIAWSVSRKYILACDAMTLLVTPIYYDFYTREMVPLKHFWPIDPGNLCNSVKSAVDWGNANPEKAQEIGEAGSKFIQEKMKMEHVYDYMFHLLTEYGKLFRYKPTVPPGAAELCSDIWLCPLSDLARDYKVESTEVGPAPKDPCTLPPPFKPFEIEALDEASVNGFKQARALEDEISRTKVKSKF